ncbi:MAG: TonB-dependent receptor [Bacteroidota bacterium]|nr:TonB-dependent receptor [Bacteroidota bacterium]
MHKLLFFLFILTSSFAFGQVKINGKITDHKNKSLPGISVSLLNSYDGATTDSAGNYSFGTSEKGDQTLSATGSGYRSYEEKIKITSSPINLNIELKELITELKAVVISAGTFEASDAKRATALNPIDIVTTASANGDITSAIKTLPGTQQVGEREGLFVRGGTADETKIFIDGTLVNKFFYSSEPGQSTRGRFNPFLFKGTIFSSGGYSALYGQALSSVLSLESIDLPDKTSADFGVSYLGANAGIQKLSKNKKSSWGITYAYANLSWVYNLIKQKFDYFKVPKTNEADINFRIITSSTGMLKYYGYFNSTDVGFRSQDVDSLNLKDAFGLENLNMYHNLSWKEYIGNGWKVNAGTSFSTNKDDIKTEIQDEKNVKQEIQDQPLYAYKNFNLTNKGYYGNAKVVFEKKLKSLSAVRFGMEDNYSDEKSIYDQYNDYRLLQSVKENILSGFGEADVYITNNVAARIGTRAEHSALLNRWNVAPRISFAYMFADKSQVSLAYGTFYQDPERKYLPSVNALHFAKATHYIVQYEKITKDRTFRTELFYKKYDDLLKTSGAYNGTFTAINNNGFGDAKGIEFFWRDKKTIKNFDYWISYSYLDTKRDFLNYPFAIEPSFVSRHTASLVIKKFVLPIRTQFNVSYTFASGRPYYDIIYDSSHNNYQMISNGRAKDYNNLSFSLNFLPSLGKTKANAFSVFILSVTNVLGFDNVYNYNYSVNGQNKVAVTPPARRFFYLGYFVSLGIDRTQDEISNHG